MRSFIWCIYNGFATTFSVIRPVLRKPKIPQIVAKTSKFCSCSFAVSDMCSRVLHPVHVLELVSINLQKLQMQQGIDRMLWSYVVQDNEILSMRHKLCLTCKQSIISPSVLALTEEQTKLTPLAATIDSRFFSPIGSVRSCSEMDDMDSKLLDFTVIPEAQDLNSEELPDASVINKGVVLVETPSRGDVGGIESSLQHEQESNEAEEAAKWYVNPMVLEAENQYFDMCTPERGAPLFAACTPAVRGSLEWMALRSSFKNRDSITSTPVPQLLPFAEFSFVSPAQVRKSNMVFQSPHLIDYERFQLNRSMLY